MEKINIVERDAREELENVIAHVQDYFDIAIEDVYNMKVETLMEYVIDMVK